MDSSCFERTGVGVDFNRSVPGQGSDGRRRPQPFDGLSPVAHAHQRTEGARTRAPISIVGPQPVADRERLVEAMAQTRATCRTR